MIWLMVNIIFVGSILYGLLCWKRPGTGLMLLPFAVIGIIVVSVSMDNPYLLTAAGFVVTISVLCARFKPLGSPFEIPWYRTLAAILIMVFKYLLLLAALTFVFRALGPVLFALIVIGVIRYKTTYRYSLAMDVLSAIGMSMRQSLPLPMALDSAAQGRRSREARIFTSMSSLLVQGRSLSDAIRLGYPNCPPELLASIEAAEKINQLPKGIEALQADIAEKVNDHKRIRPVHPWYPLLVVVVAFFLVMGLSVFIVPTFAEVVSDISEGRAGLPASTQVLLDFAVFVMGNKGFNAVFIILAAQIVIVYFMASYFRSRNPRRLTLHVRVKDWIKWHLPVFHWFERTYSQQQLAELLRVALAAGYPINTALQNAQALDMNHRFRLQVRNWLNRIEQGQPVARAALDCGLDRTLTWAFDEKINRGNTVQVLEGLEEVYRSRYSHRVNVLNAVCGPLTILGLGLGVGWIVYAMFMGVFSSLFVTMQYTMP